MICEYEKAMRNYESIKTAIREAKQAREDGLNYLKRKHLYTGVSRIKVSSGRSLDSVRTCNVNAPVSVSFKW